MAGPIHVLDPYYLALTLLVTIAYQLLFFSVAFALKFDKLTDFAGGTNFALLAVLTLSLNANTDSSSSDDDDDGPDARQIVVSLFLVVWALRLSGFLLFRILKTGKDDRFDDKRDKFFPFLGFWVFQMVWVWTVSLPVTVLNSPAVRAYRPQPAFGSTGRDVAGVLLYAVGLVIEAVSDAQKYRFRTRGSSEKKKGGGGAVCDRGFWAWSRHPNYFGEIVIQFSIYMIAVSAAADGPVGGQAFKALYATILGPIFLTALLMFVSGLPLSERPGAKKRYEKQQQQQQQQQSGSSSSSSNSWDEYRRYLDRTSILIPLPPQLYAPLPVFIKRTLLLEFPMYVFDPAKHSDLGDRGPQAVEEGRAHGGGDGGGDDDDDDDRHPGDTTAAAAGAAARQSGEPLTGGK
ncbi:hypothetical protein F4778DRAFT_784536 [Xylariomycetidae sp. FL2044]|nr:hypothetical protein F4778DRAFT_784536 [Xylariomycetidae sp. FL2044]